MRYYLWVMRMHSYSFSWTAVALLILKCSMVTASLTFKNYLNALEAMTGSQEASPVNNLHSSRKTELLLLKIVSLYWQP